MTEEEDAVAILAMLNTALSPKQAYDFDEVPASRPTEYVEFSLTWRNAGEERAAGGTGGLSGRRILCRYISQTSITNARVMQEKVRTVLGESDRTPKPLALGTESVVSVLESASTIGPDDGWFSGYDTFVAL